MAGEIRIPFKWRPRPYQMAGWVALEGGVKRAVLLWHRRAGKDLVCLNWTVVASQMRVGTYWHLFPTAKQGRKIVWDGMTNDGRAYLDFWPEGIRGGKPINTEMKLKLRNGSMWQVVGADNYDEALVGANPVGIVVSEYALQNPAAWRVLSPILAANGGWAIFPYTPRGKNHGWDLYEMARRTQGWYADKLTVDDTKGEEGLPIIGPEIIEDQRRAGVPEEFIQQEYYVSFEASNVGAYYGAHMAKATAEGRIGVVPYDPRYLVETWWDIGTGDATAIWFVQHVGMEIRLIDFYMKTGMDVSHYAGVLQQKGYNYGRHIGPHDLDHRIWGSGGTNKEAARTLGIRFEVAPKLSIEDGINAVRLMLPMCWFDAVKCADGIEALKQYTKKYDEELKRYSDEPLHDWSSDPADAARTGAVMRRKIQSDRGPRQTQAITEDNPRGTWDRGQRYAQMGE